MAEKLLLITSGCSYRNVFKFIIDRKETLKLLVDHFGKDIVHTDVGEHGRPNKWISNSVIHALEKYKHYDSKLVLVNWTGIERKHIYIDKKHSNFHKEKINFYEYTNPEYFSGGQSFRTYKWYDDVYAGRNYIHSDDKESGLLSITNIHADESSPHVIEKIVGIDQNYMYTMVERFEETLISILMLQHYCKLNNIPCFNSTWQDIWHEPPSFTFPFSLFGQHYEKDDITNNRICNYNDMPLRIDRYPQFRYLYNQINFSNWYFSKVNNTETGGIADWCINKSISEGKDYFEKIHPTAEGYKHFIDIEFMPWLMEKLRRGGRVVDCGGLENR